MTSAVGPCRMDPGLGLMDRVGGPGRQGWTEALALDPSPVVGSRGRTRGAATGRSPFHVEILWGRSNL